MKEATIKIVGFVDILGFSNIIERYDSGEIQKVIDELSSAIDPASQFLKDNSSSSAGNPFFNWKECLDIRLFSDNLCAAAPVSFKSYSFMEQLKFFYKYLIGYQIIMMEKGFFTRGAVTIGSHYADDNMIFSGGLVEAYKLETTMAKYPRIIASDSIIEKVLTFSKVAEEDINHMFVKDEEGVVFFNHFNYNLMDSKFADGMVQQVLKGLGPLGILNETFEEMDQREKENTANNIKKLAMSAMEQNNVEKIKSKYQWLIDFIDYELSVNNKRGFEKLITVVNNE